LIPELNQQLVSGNVDNIVVALESIKRICKKYRYMFRSDALYTEMNYMIENISSNCLNTLIMAV
jgi:hypothetical protein